jgi:protein-disulfide isomerase
MVRIGELDGCSNSDITVAGRYGLSADDQVLQQRGSLTVWVTPEAVEGAPTPHRTCHDEALMIRPTARHPLATALLASLLLASSGVRAASFTPEQRTEIVAILREALRSDPSILRDAVAALRAEEGAHQGQTASSAITRDREALQADPADPVAGNPAGDVTVVEFYDTRCPYCRRLLPTMEALLRAEPGVRLVYKDLPILGPSSLLDARALLAAQRQGGYLRLQEALMHATTPSTPDSIRAEAERQSLDGDRLLRDMDDPAIRARLEINAKLARDLSVQGTPALVVGQRLIPGAVELTDLRAAVAEARER